MRLGIVVPTWSYERGIRALDHYKDTCEVESYGYCCPKVQGVLQNMIDGTRGMNWVSAYAFLHDDVLIHEQGWGKGVEDLFTLEPRCGVIGFGGALGLGTADIYKVPYELNQLVRISFYSNLDDWNIHGAHLRRPIQASVLDGFCMIFRRSAYEEMGGWEAAIADGLPEFHMYDAWAACRLAELGWQTWVVPVHCHHNGGTTSCSGAYQDFVQSRGWKDGEELFQRSHRVCYDRFRKVLPLRLKNG